MEPIDPPDPDPIPTTPPDSTIIRPAPAMPPSSFIDSIASRPLFRVRTFIALLLGVVTWVAGFLGFPGLDIVLWAGPDAIMTVGELATGIFYFAAAYFTKNRKPGGVEGIFTSPTN